MRKKMQKGRQTNRSQKMGKLPKEVQKGQQKPKMGKMPNGQT